MSNEKININFFGNKKPSKIILFVLVILVIILVSSCSKSRIPEDLNEGCKEEIKKFDANTSTGEIVVKIKNVSYICLGGNAGGTCNAEVSAYGYEREDKFSILVSYGAGGEKLGGTPFDTLEETQNYVKDIIENATERICVYSNRSDEFGYVCDMGLYNYSEYFRPTSEGYYSVTLLKLNTALNESTIGKFMKINLIDSRVSYFKIIDCK